MSITLDDKNLNREQAKEVLISWTLKDVAIQYLNLKKRYDIENGIEASDDDYSEELIQFQENYSKEEVIKICLDFKFGAVDDMTDREQEREVLRTYTLQQVTYKYIALKIDKGLLPKMDKGLLPKMDTDSKEFKNQYRYAHGSRFKTEMIELYLNLKYGVIKDNRCLLPKEEKKDRSYDDDIMGLVIGSRAVEGLDDMEYDDVVILYVNLKMYVEINYENNLDFNYNREYKYVNEHYHKSKVIERYLDLYDVYKIKLIKSGYSVKNADALLDAINEFISDKVDLYIDHVIKFHYDLTENIKKEEAEAIPEEQSIEHSKEQEREYLKSLTHEDVARKYMNILIDSSVLRFRSELQKESSIKETMKEFSKEQLVKTCIGLMSFGDDIKNLNVDLLNSHSNKSKEEQASKDTTGMFETMDDKLKEEDEEVKKYFKKDSIIVSNDGEVYVKEPTEEEALTEATKPLQQTVLAEKYNKEEALDMYIWSSNERDKLVHKKNGLLDVIKKLYKKYQNSNEALISSQENVIELQIELRNSDSELFDTKTKLDNLQKKCMDLIKTTPEY